VPSGKVNHFEPDVILTNHNGVSAQRCNGKEVEIDHLIPLELGGSNDIKNLWPQPFEPRPGAHETDVLEGWLHGQVCRVGMSLSSAQRTVARDWVAAWKNIALESKRPE